MPSKSDKDIILSAVAKMAKGIKIGDIPLVTLNDAIQVIGNGWSSTPLVGHVSALTDRVVEDLLREKTRGTGVRRLPYVEAATGQIGDSGRGIHRGTPTTLMFLPDEFPTVERLLGSVELGREVPALPPGEIRHRLFKDVGQAPLRITRHDRVFFVAEIYAGVAALEVTAPNGEKLVEAAPPLLHNGVPYMSRAGFWAWVYKRGLAEAAQIFMALPENARPERVRRDASERWDINTATCGWCGSRQKLASDTTLVLHGYRRPGDGWVRGSCPGVKELPYELSCWPSERAIPANEESLATVRAWLEAGGPPSILAYERVRDIRSWHREGNKPEGRVKLVHPTQMTESDQRNLSAFHQVAVTRDDVGWSDVVGAATRDLRSYEEELVRHIAWLRKAVAEWRYRPQDIAWREGAGVPWTDFCAATANPRGRVEHAVDYVRQHAPEAYVGEPTRTALYNLLKPMEFREIRSPQPFTQGAIG